tara:strand:- start:4300 stop:4671 length:372 start_codon:yes stop_codon:yes gene_type:complete
MNGYFKRQLDNARRGTPLQARRTEADMYAGCLPQASGTGAHPLTMVRHLASQGPCWEGYHRDYSKKEGTNDSCVKNGKKKKKKKTTKKKSKSGDASSSSSASSSEDEGGESKKKKRKTKKESE